MAWATAGNIVITNLDAGTDSPASARADLKAALDELTIVSNNLGTTDGAAKIESTGVISAAVTGVATTSGALTLDPATDVVKIQNVINLNPVAFAALPGSPAMGDFAFLTTDGAGATQNQPIYYNGSRWNYFNNTANGGTDAAVATS